jgi:lipopolysaccharide/colanic/teichoic acid biosynthesis glycosyltransferase
MFDSAGPIFYIQKRVGLNGKEFNLFKFRSMRVNADKLGLLTVGGRDSRITNSGYILRKYK